MYIFLLFRFGIRCLSEAQLESYSAYSIASSSYIAHQLSAQTSNLCINILHLVRTLTLTTFKHSFCLENIWLHYYSSCLLSLYISPEYYYTKADEVKRSDTELAVSSLLATYFIVPLIQKLSALWCSCQVGLKPC